MAHCCNDLQHRQVKAAELYKQEPTRTKHETRQAATRTLQPAIRGSATRAFHGGATQKETSFFATNAGRPKKVSQQLNGKGIPAKRLQSILQLPISSACLYCLQYCLQDRPLVPFYVGCGR